MCSAAKATNVHVADMKLSKFAGLEEELIIVQTVKNKKAKMSLTLSISGCKITPNFI